MFKGGWQRVKKFKRNFLIVTFVLEEMAYKDYLINVISFCCNCRMLQIVKYFEFMIIV